jgi:hypothetical protein
MTTGAVGVSVSLLPGTSDMSEVRETLPAQGHTHVGFQASSGFVSSRWSTRSEASAGPSAMIAQCEESWTQAQTQTVTAGTAGDCKWAGIVELYLGCLGWVPSRPGSSWLSLPQWFR